MLRRFIYLDKTALGQYVTVLEGGLTTESTTRLLRSGTGTGGVDVRVINASGERSREEEESRTLADTDEARFDRLLRAAAAEPEALGWVEVLQPDTDLDGIGIGAMLSWECDLYVPEIIQTLARSGEALRAIGMIQNLLPMARTLGLNTEGLPNDEELSAVSGFVSGLDASLLVVGEDDETDWRVAGQLTDGSLNGDVEGRARVVGKVSKAVPSGRWKPYLTFPGLKLLPREERRRMERQAPAPGKEGEYLPGPALMLDILAIYR
ncbi:MAG: DUF6414 family protein [Mycobacteriales bacterium]|nr:MAG: hypothetical protein DLM56_06645 [Pseudonocardiales bacterium]